MIVDIHRKIESGLYVLVNSHTRVWAHGFVCGLIYSYQQSKSAESIAETLESEAISNNWKWDPATAEFVKVN